MGERARAVPKVNTDIAELERALTAGRGRRESEDTPEKREELLEKLRRIMDSSGFLPDPVVRYCGFEYGVAYHDRVRRRTGTCGSWRLIMTKRVPFPVLGMLIDEAERILRGVSAEVDAAIQYNPTRSLAAGLEGKQGAELLRGILLDAQERVLKMVSVPTMPKINRYMAQVEINIPFHIDGEEHIFEFIVRNGKASIDLGADAPLRTEGDLKQVMALVRDIDKIEQQVLKTLAKFNLVKEDV